MRKAKEQTQSMQRVTVGMTGLAVVLLLIGLASAIFTSASREPPVTAVGAAKPDVVANLTIGNSAVAEPPVKEPLAEIGVTPSTATEASNTAAPATPTAAPR